MKLLLVDDDIGWCTRLIAKLKDNGFDVLFEADADNAMKAIRSFGPDVVLLDILFEVQQEGSPSKFENKGKPTFDRIKEKYPDLPVVILTSTMRDTFSRKDYPGCVLAFAKDQLNSGTDETYREFAEKIKRSVKSNSNVKEDYTSQFGFVVGRTQAMQDVRDKIKLFAPTELPVLITGESGTGKELIAKAIHSFGKAGKRFYAINCSAIVATLLESELFGHEKGAFTGAMSSKRGMFEIAEDGIIFLDEIGELSTELQVKLLRVLQEKQFQRVGGTQAITLKARVITATNKNLSEEVRNGKFREDLFYRLNVCHIHLPSLRERKEDIPELLAHFIRKFNTNLSKNILIETKDGLMDFLRTDVLELLRSHNWPGNIREFENEVARAMVEAGDDNVLMPDHFGIRIDEEKGPLSGLNSTDDVVQAIWDGKLSWADIRDEISSKSPRRTEIFKKLIDKWLFERMVRPTHRDLAFLLYPDLTGETDEETRKKIKKAENNVRQKVTKECGLKLTDWPERRVR